MSPETAPEEARRLVDAVDRARGRSRAARNVLWFPLVLFGLLAIASGFLVLRLDSEALGYYWLVAGPLGGAATAVYSSRRELRVGVEVSWPPYAVTGLAIIVVAFAVVAVGEAVDAPALTAAGPSLAVSAGYLVFARLERSRPLALLAVALAALAVVLVVADVDADTTTAVLALVYGVSFATCGVVLLAQARRT